MVIDGFGKVYVARRSRTTNIPCVTNINEGIIVDDSLSENGTVSVRTTTYSERIAKLHTCRGCAEQYTSIISKVLASLLSR